MASSATEASASSMSPSRGAVSVRRAGRGRMHAPGGLLETRPAALGRAADGLKIDDLDPRLPARRGEAVVELGEGMARGALGGQRLQQPP